MGSHHQRIGQSYRRMLYYQRMQQIRQKVNHQTIMLLPTYLHQNYMYNLKHGQILLFIIILLQRGKYSVSNPKKVEIPLTCHSGILRAEVSQTRQFIPHSALR